MHTKTLFQQFRQKLYQILPKRADAILDFIDALTGAGHVASPVALSVVNRVTQVRRQGRVAA